MGISLQAKMARRISSYSSHLIQLKTLDIIYKTNWRRLWKADQLGTSGAKEWHSGEAWVFCFASDIRVLELGKPATQKCHGHRPNNTQPKPALSSPRTRREKAEQKRKVLDLTFLRQLNNTKVKHGALPHPPRLSRQPRLLAPPESNEATLPPTHPLAYSSVREDQLRQKL